MFQDTLNLLYNFPHTKKVEILFFKDTAAIRILKAKAELKDKSLIFVHERVGQGKIRYSYHWQNKKGKLSLRFDNAPHYKDIVTFPHHRHEHNKKVTPLLDPSFRNFLTGVAETK